jgi:hypothetical protein
MDYEHCKGKKMAIMESEKNMKKRENKTTTSTN